MKTQIKKEIKLGSRKVIQNSLAEYSRCSICGNNFWAESQYEEGNFKRICKECEKKEEKEYKENFKKAKIDGIKDLSVLGKIKGWRYNGEYYVNQNWINK